jgi:hypothetical protein
MPPTARPALRGVRRGLLVLTAGPVPYFYRRYPTAPVASSQSDRTRGVLALSLACGPYRGTGRREHHDPEATGLGGAQARRTQSRSWIAAALAGSRCPTPSERPASGRCSDRGAPGRFERSPSRVPAAIVGRAGACRCRISSVWRARHVCTERQAKPSRSGIRAPVCASLSEPVGELGETAVPRDRDTRQHIAQRRITGRPADRRPRRRDHRLTRVQAGTNPTRNRTL